MSEITIETYAGKLNQVGYTAFLSAMRQARGDRNRQVDLGHLLFHLLANQASDVSVTLAAQGLDRGRALKDVDRWIAGLDRNVTEHPGISDIVGTMLTHSWTYATLLFGEVQIRTGHMLVALLSDQALRRQLLRCSQVFEALSADNLARESRSLWARSDEETLRPMDGSGLGSGIEVSPDRAAATTALGRFSTDLTELARSGKMDRVVGRDAEIAGIIDVLLRRRQNNPILTGEAGVGKTAVVEGFAQRLASGDVPPLLRGQRLCMLDVGAMQAGASMRGEFEQRLRSVIDEIQASPVPIILFIDEAHTLVGAGGAAGTGDAANLLKPALARGTLRTIGATTWAEYRMHFEKDPALARRFQPVPVDEPSPERCATMLRGVVGVMEAHHKVRISDEALVAAVNLSARYIPARQLPDKAVSLLDTACARVAVSQTSTPARIRDLRVAIAALEAEVEGKLALRELGEANEDRLAGAREQIEAKRGQLATVEASYLHEKAMVDRILELRRSRAAPAPASPQAPDAASAPEPVPAAASSVHGAETLAADTVVLERPPVLPETAPPAEPLSEITSLMAELERSDPAQRMIYPHVDTQAVASVIADWTGIPVGRMVGDELKTVLELSDHLRKRVVGQDEGLRTIARRIEASRAGLSDPNKPIGVFMLCGPSGVGKTETAHALAEQLYGGEQNVITIAMSEFQEAHTVSLLKGAPPGYVGYGEGGRLTEAVRRKPYSVVLLDEIEKAHPDVHELFFQVFDKGWMEDGSGRPINFRNTVILLTSNIGTDVLMDMAGQGEGLIPEVEAMVEALKPPLLRVFPPALIGRLVVIPYLPLSREVLGRIIRLKLDKLGERLRSAQGAVLAYDDAVVAAIAERCRDPDSGGRMIDNVIGNTILPDLSRRILGRRVNMQSTETARIDVDGDGFAYVLG